MGRPAQPDRRCASVAPPCPRPAAHRIRWQRNRRHAGGEVVGRLGRQAQAVELARVPGLKEHRRHALGAQGCGRRALLRQTRRRQDPGSPPRAAPSARACTCARSAADNPQGPGGRIRVRRRGLSWPGGVATSEATGSHGRQAQSIPRPWGISPPPGQGTAWVRKPARVSRRTASSAASGPGRPQRGAQALVRMAGWRVGPSRRTGAPAVRPLDPRG